RPGWGGFFYESDIEALTLYTTQLGDVVFVQSTWPNQPVWINNRGGPDSLSVGNGSQGGQGPRAPLFFEGVGTNTIFINNNADTIARSPYIDRDVTLTYGTVNGLAPASIYWRNTSTSAVTITSGTADDSFIVYSNASYLVLNSAAGNDSVQIGSPLLGGLASI